MNIVRCLPPAPAPKEGSKTKIDRYFV